jgi:DNA-binding NarL/FixJ family response regulator
VNTHFVGRTEELAQLGRLLEDSGAGRGRLVALAGEAGIGKTRLVTEMARLATARGCRVLWSQMIEDPVAPPFLPWMLALRDALSQLDADALREDLGSGAADVADLLPELRDRLQLAPSRPSADSVAARYQLFDSVTRFLLGLSRRQPLVLLLDNAHLADRSSLLLLEYYCRQITSSRTLVVLAYRASALQDGHPLREALGRCAGMARFENLELGGLGRPEIAELMRLVAGAPVPPSVVDAVSERSDGNPLFVSEVAAGLARRLGADPAAWHEPAIDVPETLKAVITARLATLDDETAWALRVAAVLGRDFDIGLLAPLAGRPAPDILALVERAAAAGVVAVLSPGRFRFRHATFRELLYSQHDRAERLRLHREAAARIEQRFAADLAPHLQQLAWHSYEAARGGYLPEAVGHCRRAAGQALERRAYGEAAVQFERALQVADMAEDPDLSLRFELLTALGDAQYRSGQVNSAAWTCLRSALLAHRQQWWPRLAEAVLALQHVQGQLGMSHIASVPLHLTALEHLPADASSIRARLLSSIATAHRHSGDTARAQAALLGSVGLARLLNDKDVLFTCLSKALYVFWRTWESPQQLEMLREAVVLAERDGREEVYLLATMALIFPLSKLGRYAELEPLAQRLMERAEAARHPHYRQVAAGFKAEIALLRGRWSEALEWAQASRQQAAVEGSAGVEGRFGFQMFTLQRALGRLDAVEPLLQRLSAESDPDRLWLPGKILLHCEIGQEAEARRLLQRLGDLDRLPRDDLFETALVYLTEACVALRDLERCKVLYPLLEPCRGYNVTTTATVSHGAAAGYLALLAAALRRPREARALFEEALEFNVRMDAPALVARVQADYAAFLLQGDRPADQALARSLLAQARAAATRLGMEALLRRIASLGEAGAGPEDLTDRELEVLRRIALGASNKRIADELFISLSTVATHIRSILRKTGAANRTEAVAQARRSGLLPAD